MKCPFCGRETISLIADINAPADFLGCDDCLPPEKNSEDLIEIFDSDPEWITYAEENGLLEPEEEDEEEDANYWNWYNAKEDEAIERYYSAR